MKVKTPHFFISASYTVLCIYLLIIHDVHTHVYYVVLIFENPGA